MNLVFRDIDIVSAWLMYLSITCKLKIKTPKISQTMIMFFTGVKLILSHWQSTNLNRETYRKAQNPRHDLLNSAKYISVSWEVCQMNMTGIREICNHWFSSDGVKFYCCFFLFFREHLYLRLSLLLVGVLVRTFLL